MTDSKPRVPCEQCGKTYASQNSLGNLVKQVHSDERPFTCSKGCDKRFNMKGEAVSHERTHTQERPFQCDQCSKSFSDPSSWTRHTRTHTGERPYQCEECGKGFTQQQHLATHSRIHSGEKPFACTHFTSSSILTTHLRTHTGEKPYKCEFCDYRCTASSYIIKHERRMHAAEFNTLQAAFMRGGVAAAEAVAAAQQE